MNTIDNFLRPAARKVIQSAVLVAFTLLLSSCTNTVNTHSILPGEAELTALMKRMVDDEERATGMVIGMIAPNEKVIVGYGRLGETNDRIPDADSLFEIGSISKVFIGTLLADSVQRGEVSLDDSISKYLPASVRVPDFNGTPITLLDLATHTSGLPKDLPPNPDGTITSENWVQVMYHFLSSYELLQKPGMGFEYSNLGMSLLAHILELRTGLSYDSLLAERILKPLGMDDTYLPLPNTPQHERLATGHNNTLHPYPAGAYIYNEPELRYVGGIISSAEDMLKFASAAMGMTETPLLPAFKDATTPRRSWLYDKSGLAWIITEGQFPFIHHSGDTHGMHSFFGFDPQRRVAVVVLANANVPKDDLGPYLLHPERYALETYSPRSLPAPKQLDSHILASYAGEYELELDGTVVAAITIKVDGQQLIVYKDGEMDFSMIAETETRFVAVELEALVDFIVIDGIVTGFVLDQATANEDYTFTKVDRQK